MCMIKIVIKSVIIKILFKTISFFILQHIKNSHIHVFLNEVSIMLVILSEGVRQNVIQCHTYVFFLLIRTLVTTVRIFKYIYECS